MNEVARFSISNREFAIDLGHLSDRCFSVASSPRPYTVSWEESAATVVSKIVDALNESPTDFLLVDTNVFRIYFSGAKPPMRQCLLLDAVETKKNIDTVLATIDALEALSPSKNSMIHVVGGGITEDIGAFAACIYKRGMPWTFYPTTLLSMCDSCIGGKTGINYKNGKNQLALFSAPRAVAICPEFLSSLTDREINSGYGEILKLLVTGGDGMLRLYGDAFDPILKMPARSALKDLIFGALLVKKAVVEEDEFELDLRRSLNYGHTIGHALEVLSNYAIPHGQAVTLGLMIVNRMARERGLLPVEIEKRINRFAIPLLKATDLSTVAYDGLAELLQRDKKTQTGKFVFVFISDIGRTLFVDYPKTPDTIATIQSTIRDLIREVEIA